MPLSHAWYGAGSGWEAWEGLGGDETKILFISAPEHELGAVTISALSDSCEDPAPEPGSTRFRVGTSYPN